MTLPAFPGAKGFGSTTVHGSGRSAAGNTPGTTVTSTVYKVQTLDDDPANPAPGSFRYAVTQTGPRIVVFEVSGTITLNDMVVIKTPYLFIAGQTAPSPGINFKGGTIRVSAHDVLIQHIRSRIGDMTTSESLTSKTNISFANMTGGTERYNLVVDHCSLSWCINQAVTSWPDSTHGGVHDFTVCNSILAEGLDVSSYITGEESRACLIGDKSKNASVFNNLLLHNNGRLPLIKGGSQAVVLNNIIYNSGRGDYWSFLANDYNSTDASNPHYASFVNNKYIFGPDSGGSPTAIRVRSNCNPSYTQVYYSGNDLSEFGGTIFSSEISPNPTVGTPPIWEPTLETLAVADLENTLKANCGARPIDRDSVDIRLISELTSRSGNIIVSQSGVGGYPVISEEYAPFTVPADANVVQSSGYTKIEELIHQYSAQVEPGGSGGGSTTPETFYTDFSSDTPDTPPSGWTTQWDGGTWTVRDEGINVLEHTDLATGRFALSWDSVGTRSETVEIVSRVKPTGSNTNTGPGVGRLVIHGSGISTANGYFAGLVSDLSGAIAIAKYDTDGSHVVLGTSTGHNFIAAGSYCYLRFRWEAGVLKIRVWETEEPTSVWHIEVPDATFSSGWVGVSDWSDASSTRYAFVGVATGGGTAPMGSVTVSASASDGITLSDSSTATGGRLGFVSDTFTDSNGTLLENHTGEYGATWTKHGSSTASMEIQDNQAEKV